MSILSLVAHVDALDISFVEKELSNIKGVEILNIIVEKNKILLLLDEKDEGEFDLSLRKLQELKQLKSLSYAVHYSEEAINQSIEN